jgi:hypothetical protein
MDVINPFTANLYQNLAVAPTAGQVGDVTCNLSGLGAGLSTTCAGTVNYEAAGTDKVWGQEEPLTRLQRASKVTT